MNEQSEIQPRCSNLPKQKNLRRHLRQRATPAERALWQLLRHRQLNGLRFRRQHSIGRYVVDFFCAEDRLVVELDGEMHDHPIRARQDRRRQEYLESLNLRVLRFRNEDVLTDFAAVLDRITISISEFQPVQAND